MTKWKLLVHLLDILAFSIRTMFNKDNFLLQEKRSVKVNVFNFIGYTLSISIY